ncbi:hypothetical protein [Maritalea sp.]|uniref:hypothetical protein n=1 Tax=Maritalea sp. TaxID=2003361 RepID=UPI003EFA2E7E
MKKLGAEEANTVRNDGAKKARCRGRERKRPTAACKKAARLAKDPEKHFAFGHVQTFSFTQRKEEAGDLAGRGGGTF